MSYLYCIKGGENMKVDSTRIKILLIERQLSVKEFCKINNLSYSTVSAILRGQRIGQLKTIGQIADALDVSIDSILKEGE